MGKDNDRVYVLYDNGYWASYGNTWHEGDPAFTCGTSSSPPTPMMGFGKVWCTYSDVRQGLGDSVNAESGDYGAVQEFSSGLILQIGDEQAYVLYSDGTWMQ